MKKLTAIFAIAALAGCTQTEGIPSLSVEHLQTMMSAAPGEYTFIPYTGSRFDLPVMNGDPWNLAVKLDQYKKTEGPKDLLCAHFRTVVINLSEGKYLLPYQRVVSGENTSYQAIQVPLKNFEAKTLMNITEKLDGDEYSNEPFFLAGKTPEVCVPQYGLK
jgi:hypothetical protein